MAARLVGHARPESLTAVIIGHMHADHFIDLAALRYAFSWGERTAERLAVLLPPGGLVAFAELAGVVSERQGFFDDAFDVREYDPAASIAVGDLGVSFVPGRHYVPAWGVALTAADGTRLVYAGDTGPNPGLIEAARGADLLVCEATLGSAADDDPGRRGHLSLDEALDHAQQAARRAGCWRRTTHRPGGTMMAARLAELGGWAMLARPDLVVDVPDADAATAAEGPTGRGRSSRAGTRVARRALSGPSPAGAGRIPQSSDEPRRSRRPAPDQDIDRTGASLRTAATLIRAATVLASEVSATRGRTGLALGHGGDARRRRPGGPSRRAGRSRGTRCRARAANRSPPPRPKISVTSPQWAQAKPDMFSTMPVTGTFIRLSIAWALPTSSRATSCGVVTRTAPLIGTAWARVSCASEVPGGRSMTR